MFSEYKFLLYLCEITSAEKQDRPQRGEPLPFSLKIKNEDKFDYQLNQNHVDNIDPHMLVFKRDMICTLSKMIGTLYLCIKYLYNIKTVLQLFVHMNVSIAFWSVQITALFKINNSKRRTYKPL